MECLACGGGNVNRDDKFCQYRGHEIVNESDKFCTNCGIDGLCSRE